MQCKEFASVLEQQGLSPLPDAAQEHLAECLACQDFLADLDAIVATASELPAEVDPPQRIWVSLRAQLEAEGLVKEPVLALSDSSANWLEGLRAWFTVRRLAAAGVGLSLAIAAFWQLHKPHPAVSPSPTPEIAKVTPPAPVSVPPAQPTAQPTIVATLPSTQPAARMQQARRPVRDTQLGGLPMLATAPSEDLYIARSAALNQAENDVPNSSLAGNPALDESLRKNLRTVNEFIAECQAHLKKYPDDTLAREYLDSALQQKAELIAAMLDSGRSEQ
jgi:hypothetical protein